MKRSKFTDSQIIEALKRVEGGVPAPEICREYGISTATFYKWRTEYGYNLLFATKLDPTPLISVPDWRFASRTE